MTSTLDVKQHDMEIAAHYHLMKQILIKNLHFQFQINTLICKTISL